jgi:hypothetical protein
MLAFFKALWIVDGGVYFITDTLKLSLNVFVRSLQKFYFCLTHRDKLIQAVSLKIIPTKGHFLFWNFKGPHKSRNSNSIAMI